MKKATNYWLLAVTLLLVLATISCQSATPIQTDDIKPAFELRVDILGRAYAISLDDESRLAVNTALASSDGTVILSIDKGTQLLSKDSKPLSSIWINTEQEQPVPPQDAHIIGEVYSLGPQDAVFDRPIKLTFNYNPQELPEGIKESDVYIAPYHEGSGWGQLYYKRMDTGNHCVTTLVSGYGSFAVIAPVKPEPEPANIASPPNLLEVVYFHRPQRCSGCVYAETGTRYTLEAYFSEELVSGKIVFKVINLADKANAAIVEHYGAHTSSLFMSSNKDSTEHIEEVTEIWFLLGKDSEFVNLVKNKVDRYLSGEIP